MRLTMNALVNGMHGKIGKNLIVRTLRGKIVASQAPKKPQYESAEQRKNRDRFRDASAYAKRMMNIPERKVYFQKKAAILGLPNAYTAAITEFMRRPVIIEVNAEPQPDGRLALRVLATKKDFPVKDVTFVCVSEKGDCTETICTPDRRGYYMCYLDKTISSSVAISVSDEPENRTTKEFTIPDLAMT